MHFAQDPKVKTPTMTELVSDLSLQYITLDSEARPDDPPSEEPLGVLYHQNQLNNIRIDSELSTLASVLFTITGHREWNSKAEAHKRQAQRAQALMLRVGSDERMATARQRMATLREAQTISL